MRPTKEVSNLCRSDDDKKIFKDKMTLRMEFERYTDSQWVGVINYRSNIKDSDV